MSGKLKSPRRRQLVIAGGLGLASAVAGAQTGAQREKFVVMMDWLPSWRQGAFHLANTKGWYQEAGLDVEVVDGSGSSNTILQSALNKCDIGLASLSALAVARGKGTDALAIAGIVRRNDLGMLVDKKLGIADPRQLAERNAAILFEATSFQSLFPPFFKNIGVDTTRVKLQPMSAASAIGTYLAGQGDALITTVPYVMPLVDQQRPSGTVMFGDHGLPLPAHGLVASPATLKEKAAGVRRFLAVTSRAWQQVWTGNAEEAIAALQKERPLARVDAALELKRVQAYRPYANTPATVGKPVLFMPPQDWDAAMNVMRQAQLVPADAKAADYYTNAFIPA
jgi:NitT/TauT family transport system substrate-binding protein